MAAVGRSYFRLSKRLVSWVLMVGVIAGSTAFAACRDEPVWALVSMAIFLAGGASRELWGDLQAVPK